MLPDSDDLLSQLSCELGLPDLMDNDIDNPVLAERQTDNLYDRFLSATDNDEHNLFSELLYSEGEHDLAGPHSTPMSAIEFQIPYRVQKKDPEYVDMCRSYVVKYLWFRCLLRCWVAVRDL